MKANPRVGENDRAMFPHGMLASGGITSETMGQAWAVLEKLRLETRCLVPQGQTYIDVSSCLV